MGLFSSKKVTTVSTSASRVIQDNLLPDSAKTGVANALFSDDGQFVEHILESATGSIGRKAENMYRYGESTYTYGLPRSSLYSNKVGQSAVQDILSGIVGQPVTIEYYGYGVLNNLHYAWQTLVNGWGYNPTTNEITSLSASRGWPVYLNDIEVFVADIALEEIESNTLVQWGTSAKTGYTPRRRTPLSEALKATVGHTPIAVDRSSETDYFWITYTWSADPAGIKNIIDSWVTLPMTQEDLDKEYFQVKYSYTAPGDTTPTYGYWTYQDGLGTWPVLDALYQGASEPFGSYFPIGYFRYNKAPTSTDTSSTEYRHSKKLMQYLGLDYADVRDSINANPDIEDIESALLILGVPAVTTTPIEQRYLFDFFKKLHLRTKNVIFAASLRQVALYNNVNNHNPSEASIVIQDARFKMAVKLDGLFLRTRVGVIGDKGTYSSVSETRWVTMQTTSYANQDDEIGTPTTINMKQPCFLFRHQVTETLYEELEVIGLGTKYFVWRKYADLATLKESALLIPLDHDITEHYSFSERELLYARSLHFVFNTRIVTKLSWYEQDWFQFVILVVAVFISALTFNPAPLMAAIAAGGVILLNFIVVTILKSLILSYVLKLFVKALGPQFAMLVAIIATVYSIGSGMANGGSLQGVPWGEELLQLSSGITKAVQENLQDSMLDIQEDFKDLQAFAEEQDALLDKAEALLNNTSLLSPFVVFGESPSEYCDRTIHSGNIGVLGLDAVTSYCDIALTLPKLSQTMGDTFNTEAFAFNNLG